MAMSERQLEPVVGMFVGWTVARAVVEGDCVTTEILSSECDWENPWDLGLEPC